VSFKEEIMSTKKRRLFGHRRKTKEAGQVSLQITSMADIFTILLVFLLKGIASDALTINPSNGTNLPNGINTSALSEIALTVELSSKGVLVEKEFISDYKNFEKPLGERLAKEREKQNLIAGANDTVKSDARVIVLADSKVPFSTTKVVLRTLAQSGYSEVKFGVIKE
jgi:biopolymer transport protein ExbD